MYITSQLVWSSAIFYLDRFDLSIIPFKQSDIRQTYPLSRVDNQVSHSNKVGQEFLPITICYLIRVFPCRVRFA